MPTPKWSPHGIVFAQKKQPDRPILIDEIGPGAGFEPFIECYWSMRWDLPEGEVAPAIVVPSGSFNFVFDAACPWEPMRARLVGIRETAYHMEFKGKGLTTGVRFVPGAFSGFFDGPLAPLVDQALGIGQALSYIEKPILDRMLIAETLPELRMLVESALVGRIQCADHANLNFLERFFCAIATKTGPISIRELADELGTTERRLQRSFDRHVGVSPKTILKTKRFQDVADSLLVGGAIDWVQFALEMGYYDQSHLLNDFRAITGLHPRDLRPRPEAVSLFSKSTSRSFDNPSGEAVKKA